MARKADRKRSSTKCLLWTRYTLRFSSKENSPGTAHRTFYYDIFRARGSFLNLAHHLTLGSLGDYIKLDDFIFSSYFDNAKLELEYIYQLDNS